MAVVEAIQTTYLEADGAEASYIIWDDIPSTYEHLEIRFSAQSNRASYGNDDMLIRLGDTGHSPVDTGSNYSYQYVYAHSTTKAAYPLASQTSMLIPRVSTKYAGAANFAGGSFVVLDYANADKNTSVMALSGMVSSLGTGANDVLLRFGGAVWDDVSVVNAILLNPVDGTSWQRGSAFTLYGWKNS